MTSDIFASTDELIELHSNYAVAQEAYNQFNKEFKILEPKTHHDVVSNLVLTWIKCHISSELSQATDYYRLHQIKDELKGRLAVLKAWKIWINNNFEVEDGFLMPDEDIVEIDHKISSLITRIEEALR